MVFFDVFVYVYSFFFIVLLRCIMVVLGMWIFFNFFRDEFYFFQFVRIWFGSGLFQFEVQVIMFLRMSFLLMIIGERKFNGLKRLFIVDSIFLCVVGLLLVEMWNLNILFDKFYCILRFCCMSWFLLRFRLQMFCVKFCGLNVFMIFVLFDVNLWSFRFLYCFNVFWVLYIRFIVFWFVEYDVRLLLMQKFFLMNFLILGLWFFLDSFEIFLRFSVVMVGEGLLLKMWIFIWNFVSFVLILLFLY